MKMINKLRDEFNLSEEGLRVADLSLLRNHRNPVAKQMSGRLEMETDAMVDQTCYMCPVLLQAFHGDYCARLLLR